MAQLDWYFHAMCEAGASDLHVSTTLPPMIRVDGELEAIPECEPFTNEDLYTLLFEIMPEKNRNEFEETRDTDFAYEVPEVGRFRSNVYMERKGIGGAFRIIPSDILTFEDLNLPEVIRKFCYLPKGLILITGPTGSGKSTTLCAVIDLINRTRNAHIITVEDPIEFTHESKKCLIHQREVGVHTKGFKSALRAALREDPDIILVGELRDLETVAIALEMAETGHLVFGTLHTNNAPATVDRVIDQFPSDQQEQIRVMLTEALKGVVAQVLCKKRGGGRIAALEILVVNSAVGNLIREAKTYQIPSSMQTGKSEGMQTMTDALMEHIRRGLIDPTEGYMKAVDKKSMAEALNEGGFYFEEIMQDIPNPDEFK